MRLFESFGEWLQNIFEYVTNLYDKEPDTFFIGAIIIILILLIIVLSLARKVEESEDKPKKKIKYDDIDWSTQDDAEKAAEKTEKAPEAAAPETKEGYGIKADDERNAYAGHEGLPPEIAEALLRKASASGENFSVPMWMTKHTLSLDEMEAINAQEWVEQQLREKEAAEHDKAVELATVEKIAAILEKLEMDEDDLLKDTDAEPQTEPVPEPNPEVKPEPVKQAELEAKPEPEPEPEAKPESEKEPEADSETEPKVTKVSYDTGTLEKIIKEAEELKEAEAAPEEEGPDWNIAATLAKLEAMNTQNEEIASEIEAQAGAEEIAHKAKSEPYLSEILSNEPEYSAESVIEEFREQIAAGDGRSRYSAEPVNDIESSEPVEVRTVIPKRFGKDNIDTNRQGRKFTEEELIKQIRD